MFVTLSKSLQHAQLLFSVFTPGQILAPRVPFHFACNGAWVSERYMIIVRKLISYIVISKRDINLTAWHLFVLSVVRVW